MVNDFYNDSANYAYWASVIYPSTRESRRQTLHKNRAEFVINSLEKYRKVEGNLRVLEIGAGTGDTLSVLREASSAAIEAWALEPNRSMQASLVANDIKIWEGSSRESFDLVIGFEVLEHFLEPNDFFEICLNALKPNGIIILSTPNAQSFEVQLLRNKSTTLDIEHISVLTPTAINLLAKKNGFEVKEITTPGSFDLELLEKELGEIKFLTGENAVSSRDLQDIIANCGFSSHMRAVLALNEE
jgi:SAM-dependent methyltransferase